jgi:exosortase
MSESVTSLTPPWKTIAWFFFFLILAYLPVVLGLMKQWNIDEDMGHAFFVPLVAAYVAWDDREKILSVKPEPSLFGVILMLWGMIQLYLGALGAEFFLQRSALLISTVGLVLATGGWRLLKALVFPLSLLIFMIPIPAIIYNRITFPLQLFASSVAENVLLLLDIPVNRDGNVLTLASQTLSVVEACSGIRSLLSLSFLSLVYAYFFDKRPMMRLYLFLATIPIAIIANAGRVTITGILSEWVSPEMARGFYHEVEGWVVFMIAGLLLALTHQVFSRILTWREARLAH